MATWRRRRPEGLLGDDVPARQPAWCGRFLIDIGGQYLFGAAGRLTPGTRNAYERDYLMTRIAVFGAAGRAGSRIVAEAAARGHQVMAVARDIGALTALPDGVRAVAGDATDPHTVAALAKDADVLVLTVGSPDAALYTDAVAAAVAAVRALAPAGPRIIHMGGGSSLLNDDGVRFFDAPGFPEEFRPHAIGQIRALDAYLALDESVTWTYLSPPPVHFAPGERTGHYRTGLDHPVTGEDGQAHISYEDYAAALVDEIENPRHLNRRFTMGY